MNPENPSPEKLEPLRSSQSPFSPVLERLFVTTHLTSAEFDKRILEPSDRLRMVFFWGTNCPNCESAAAHLAAMAGELTQLKVDFHAVNAYENMDLVDRFSLYGIPAFLFFKHGRLISRLPSFPLREEFLAALRRQL